MTEPSAIAIYKWLVATINHIGIKTYSASQSVPRHLPVCRVQLLTGNPTLQYHNAREYSYSFQIDVIDAQNKLTRSLTTAYQIISLCRQAAVPGYAVSINGEPSLTSMVDTSTSQTLNRQIIRVNYNVIEDAVY